MDNAEILREKRRQILRDILKKSENEVLLGEIKELLTGISKKELKYIPDKSFSSNIKKLADALENLPEMPKLIEKPPIIVQTPKKVDVDWENAPRPLKNINIDWENAPKIKPPVKQLVEVEGLDKTLEKLLPLNEIPEDVTMELNNKDLWKRVSINYPNETINISIDRNTNDIINRLIFSKG